MAKAADTAINRPLGFVGHQKLPFILSGIYYLFEAQWNVSRKTMENLYGLEWKRLGGVLEPQWLAEPSLQPIEQVSRKYLQLDEAAVCTVELYQQLESSKIFAIDTNAGRWFMCVIFDSNRKTARTQTFHSTQCMPWTKTLDLHGLKWEETLWSLEPRWSAEPSIEQIEQISRQYLDLDKDTVCTVNFYAKGGFNKLFTVDANGQEWLMRVALPVDPYLKIASEVCTMSFVRKNTSAPVPAIFGHNASNKNKLQFEWILMQRMSGVTLKRAWRKMPMSQKENLVRKLAQFQSELFRDANRFQAIGNIFQVSPESYKIGKIVSMTFFWGDRGARAVNRGPFQNSYEWLLARLNLVLEDQGKILANSKDEDDLEDAQLVKSVAERLIALLPTIFRQDEVESTILFHDDLHKSNILVDQFGNITAVLDWECVSFFPLWMACQPPHLLNGRTRAEEPRRDIYASPDPEYPGDNDEENEGVTSLYWDDLLEYERGQLRPIFLSEMERLEPAWFAEYNDGELKRDFELAVLYCDMVLFRKRVRQWLNAYEKGERYSLRKTLGD